ncbi:hypothetical protein [Flavobacterium praedii]|uniref:hypothetical protein n=1 Tax=Flavobacterium praedii TaxID=3002900 RepID=UPI0024820776|nr:hypothetical protein [Flavobacterium praedii]
MKLKYTLVFSIISFFITTIGFSQELSDQEIGFDVARTTIMLKEHGVKDLDLIHKITMMRDMQLRQYLEIKKVENGILQKIKNEVSARPKTGRLQIVTDIPATEKVALKALYDSTGGDNWSNTVRIEGVWDFSKPVTSWNWQTRTGWYGVTVNNEGHVVNISLNSNNLNNLNVVFPNLDSLTSLGILELGDNPLTGSLTNLQHLTSLKSLGLSRTNFTDTLLPITSLINLESLSITYCDNITGSIPDEFYSLKNLIYLNFDQTNGLRGGLSYKIGDLMSLTFLQLGQNLGGKFPLEICNLSKLEYLLLNNTGMTGVLPSEIVNLRNLKQLDLLNNGYLTCNLTNGICNLIKLNLLHISGNSIGGIIPPEIAQLKELRSLILGHNFTGKIPTEIGRLSELETLWIGSNKLEGVIPSEITNLKKLNLFWIFRNKFRFIDFVTEFQAYKTKLGSAFDYSNQSKINTLEAITKPSGQSVDLKMYADGDTRYLVDDTYQWFKNGNAITGATSSEYTIPSLLSTDTGTYTCRSYHLTNPDMSPLVLEREPITLKVINSCISGTIETPKPATTVDGITVTFNTTATGLTYEWRFYYLNGTTSGEVFTTQTANRRFQDAGIYKVTLDVTDATGCKAHFEKMVTVTHLCTIATGEIKINPSRKDDLVVVGYPIKFNSEIVNAIATSYDWTFYNLDGTIKENIKPLPPYSTEIAQTYTATGSYKVTLSFKDFFDCPTTFEKIINVVDTCEIPAEISNRYYISIANTNYYESNVKVPVNSPLPISFDGYVQPASDNIYSWKLYNSNGDLVETSTQSHFTISIALLGEYNLELQMTDYSGCSAKYFRTMNVVDICTFTEDSRAGSIYVTDNYFNVPSVKINEPKELNFRFYSGSDVNISYEWQLYDPSLNLISTSNQKIFPFVLTTGGLHKVVLLLKDNVKGCTTELTKKILCTIENSCTELNPKSVTVKVLYFNLLNNLMSRSFEGETDDQINASEASPELIALKPYITNGTGDKIYNYKTTRNGEGETLRDGSNNYITQIDFSFAPNREYDVHLSFPYGTERHDPHDFDIYFDLSQYIASEDYLVTCYEQNWSKKTNKSRVILLAEDCTLESEVRYIDFCPTDCKAIEGTLSTSAVTPFINTSVKFSFETTATNLTYNWTVTNAANQTLDTTSNNSRFYSFIGTALGDYTISLKVIDDKNCSSEFTKSISVVAAPILVGCTTHFNFNFKLPDNKPVYGGITLDLESRKNIARGVAVFLSQNVNKKLFITTFDDSSGGPRLLKNNFEITTAPGPVINNGTFEVYDDVTRYIRLQDDNYNNTFSTISNGISSNTQISNIDVSFFIISDDKYSDINSVKTAYQNLISSTKTKKIFFVLVQEGQFKNFATNTFLSPLEFITQIKGSTPVDYSATNSIYTSDYVMFSKAQVADIGFQNVFKTFLDKSYDEAKRKKCVTASCVATNPNAQVVKGLFINLVNKLQSLPAGTVTNGYTCAELVALTPFITFPNPAIYNYNQGSFSFSNLVNNNDVFMGANAQVTDVNLESYIDSETETNFIAKFGSIEKGCSVKHINFCPEKLCTPIEGVLKSTPQVLNAKVNASFSLETLATNLTYDWTFYNLDNTTVLAKATTALASQSFSGAGRYRVVLNVKDDKGCETPFETFTTVLPACTPITGVIKIGSGSSPTPTPTPAPTQSYWYQAVHPIGHTGTDYVIYIDGNGVKQTYTLTRTESGYNAPCTEIIASSIVNHSGVIPCVLSCNEYEIVGGTNGRTVSFTNCDGMSQTVIVPAGDSLPVCSRMVIGGATLIGPCDAGSVTTPNPTPTPAPTALIGFSNVGVSESFPGNSYPNGGNFLYAIGHADIKLDGLGIVKGDSVTIEFQYFSSFTPTHYYNISYSGVNNAFVPLPLYTPSSITIVYNGIDKTIGINLLSPFSQFLKSNTSGTASLRIVSVNGASMQIDTNNNSLQLISPATAGIGVTFKK